MTGRQLRTRDAAYFERLYAEKPDPWNFTGSAYEHQKYAATIGMLNGRRFANGLEIGCSIGVLTKQLAHCCIRLLAVDIVEQALVQAGARCAVERHVSFERMEVPKDWPTGCFDLIVLSEVLYFLNREDIERTAAMADASLAPNGVLLLVNYTEDMDEPCSGEKAAEIFMNSVAAAHICVDQLRSNSFRIDMIQKRK
jgi:predicted TPR repeat methyltransferase